MIKDMEIFKMWAQEILQTNKTREVEKFQAVITARYCPNCGLLSIHPSTTTVKGKK